MKLVITVKRSMAAVFVLAILMSFMTKELVKRRTDFLYDFAYHTRREAEELVNLENFARNRREMNTGMKDGTLAMFEKSSQLRVVYHAEMKQRFQFAANHPWQSVGPIPNEPGEDLL